MSHFHRPHSQEGVCALAAGSCCFPEGRGQFPGAPAMLGLDHAFPAPGSPFFRNLGSIKSGSQSHRDPWHAASRHLTEAAPDPSVTPTGHTRAQASPSSCHHTPAPAPPPCRCFPEPPLLEGCSLTLWVPGVFGFLRSSGSWVCSVHQDTPGARHRVRAKQIIRGKTKCLLNLSTDC